MKKWVRVLFLFLSYTFVMYAQNILKNENFTKPLANEVPNKNGVVDTRGSWIKFENSGGKGVIKITNGWIEGYSMNQTAPEHALQLIQAPIQMKEGKIYRVYFDADAQKESEINIKIGADNDRNYYGYWNEKIKLLPSKKRYEYTFKMMASTDTKARFEIWFTGVKDPVRLKNLHLEEIGDIPKSELLGIKRFDTQKIYMIKGKNDNFLSNYDIKKIKNSKKFAKEYFFEKEGKYRIEIENLKEKEKYRLKIDNKDMGIISNLKNNLIFQYNGEMEKKAKVELIKLNNFRNDKIKISLKKYIGNLIWEEKFDYTGLPKTKDWNYEVGGNGWGNGELQFYTENKAENAYVKNGKLIITALNKKIGKNNYTSARLTTKNKHDLLYGRVEVVAKLPDGIGTWPAIWMMPTDQKYGSWPKSGEIDIMEHVGYDKGIVSSTIHCESYYWGKSNQITNKIEVKDATETFHLYALEWTPKVIKAYKDNELYFIYEKKEDNWNSWPFDKKFYLILNIAVGGSWGGQKGIDNNAFPQKLEIDSIRFYDLGYKKGKISK